jgi:3-hydroxy-9,10-secoandrosta-1,3,5(10)-triene-9,17-dione monooxygenase
MGLAPVAGTNETTVVVVPRSKFEVLDNWGDLIGLKGSRSNSVVVDDVFVSAHHAIPLAHWMSIDVTTTPGYEYHGNPMYDAAFMAIALGELTSVQVGNAQGAVDEYENLLIRSTRKVAGTRRVQCDPMTRTTSVSLGSRCRIPTPPPSRS